MTFITVLFAFIPILSTLPPPTTLPFEEKVLGKSKYGAETLEKVEGAGFIQLNGTKVTESLHVNGSLISNNAEIGLLTVLGEANLRDTKVEKEARFVGYLQAHKAIFLKPIVLTSQKAVFTACKLDSITFERDGSYKGKQFLELKQGTSVTGSVDFKGGKGEIHLYSGSKIEGQVTGGTIIRKN